MTSFTTFHSLVKTTICINQFIQTIVSNVSMVVPFQFVTHVRLPIIHTASKKRHLVTVPGIAKTAKMESEFIIKVSTLGLGPLYPNPIFGNS